MPTVQPFPAGGYRFISHQFQYSGGVAAEPGFRIERARFARSLPLADGFDAIEAYLARIGRSPVEWCTRLSADRDRRTSNRRMLCGINVHCEETFGRGRQDDRLGNDASHG